MKFTICKLWLEASVAIICLKHGSLKNWNREGRNYLQISNFGAATLKFCKLNGQYDILAIHMHYVLDINVSSEVVEPRLVCDSPVLEE